MKLSDLLDEMALSVEIMDGFVNARKHPEFPELVIFNYTPATQFANRWNDITKVTRGLIVNMETDEVLARPFSKFLNYGQPGAPEIDVDAELFHLGDKIDGSLGIAYKAPNGLFYIATRGSFDSEQARHANEWLHSGRGVATRVLIESEIDEWSSTPLFEIVYPENLIVVNYGDRDELVYLGSVEIGDGRYVAPTGRDLLPRTFRSVLAEEPRPNAEGYVVWVDPWTAVKIKQQDYVELHRVVTGLNRKSVWREIQKGPKEFREWVAQLPDELYAWAYEVADELHQQFAKIVHEADGWYISTLDEQGVFPDDEPTSDNFWAVDRKRFAELVNESVPANLRGYVFSLLDGRDISAKIWAEIEPKGGDK